MSGEEFPDDACLVRASQDVEAVRAANGINHYVEIEGEGVPRLVICIAGTALYQQTLSPELRKHLQLIFYEVRGSGRSEGVSEQVTLEQLVMTWKSSARALGSPDSVSHAILIGTPPHMKIGAAQERYWDAVASEERKAIHERSRTPPSSHVGTPTVATH